MVKKVTLRHEKTRERELWVDGVFMSEKDMKEAKYSPCLVSMLYIYSVYPKTFMRAFL